MEIINEIPTPEECASLIFEYSGRKVAPKVAEDLWRKILQHKWVLSEKLGRDVGTKVTCLDFIENIEPMNPQAQDSENIQYLKRLGAIMVDQAIWETYEVFRDLGAAFGVVLILIYVLVVGWFASFKTPFVIMAAIPFSLVGILPAHWAMGAFFTATSMIGFIAGAGIVVRNSIILVDFVELRLSHGMPLEEAVVDAGAVRFRPMMLTAAAVVVGASVILFDPIFQGLAISLMAGEVASLLLSRMAVPVLYYLAWRGRV